MAQAVVALLSARTDHHRRYSWRVAGAWPGRCISVPTLAVQASFSRCVRAVVVAALRLISRAFRPVARRACGAGLRMARRWSSAGRRPVKLVAGTWSSDALAGDAVGQAALRYRGAPPSAHRRRAGLRKISMFVGLQQPAGRAVEADSRRICCPSSAKCRSSLLPAGSLAMRR